MAPSMEATTANFEALFDRVRADLERGEVQRPRHGGKEGAARAPRGPPSARRFWMGNKWLEKRRLGGRARGLADGVATGLAASEAPGHAAFEGATAANPHRRAKRTKFRTLTVAPSNVVSPPRGRGRPRRTPPIPERTEADPPVPETGLLDDFEI